MDKNATYKKLVEEAIKMLNFSYVPYSHFHVGAALLTTEDEIYTGCNIENSAFGPTNCAERTAFFKAISEGKKTFKAIAIVGGPNGIIKDFCPPCGVCRQVMREFCKDDFEIILGKSPDNYIVKTLKEILPLSFGSEDLEK
ncbi:MULTISPECIES: cytidine deaminase [Treponema]|uniref:Cytidine deaminase n=1 Tax=Treponema rectale TaxID=744512 RepID=A0A840SDM3_9SPIR|nr:MULTISPECIES: cytidine deaminase [Treponema]MBB5218830.1 cytidine deaminase [Treponema rectale]MBE6353317.1 cytidine deaminase [Treponema sp.]